MSDTAIEQAMTLALQHHQAGRFTEAETIYRQILDQQPDDSDALHLLGVILHQTGREQSGLELIQRAIAIVPSVARYHNNLGNIFREKSRFTEAFNEFRTAVKLQPDYANAYYNLGAVLQKFQQFDAAAVAYRKAAELKHDDIWAYNNLGNVYKDLGRLDESIQTYQNALKIDPGENNIHSNIVLTLHYHPDFDVQAIFLEERRWNKVHAEPLKKFIQPHTNDRDAERKLRIGYVSADFRQHAVGCNLLPLLREHDRTHFEIVCYSNVVDEDLLTRQLRTYADVWRDIVKLTHQEAAQMIRDDKIDILVDLALHTHRNRLLIFAQKPAPVQATFMGYPGSTGMDAVDYRLTDPYLDPPGMFDTFYSEKCLRLPETFWCYDPLNNEHAISDLPAAKNGFVTFGCLNNFCKVNEGVLKLWAKVLDRVPNSRLISMAPLGEARQRVLKNLNNNGVDLQRVEFVEFQPRKDYFKVYHRIDVGLDTLPYNGHTTSLDSLWMGVPVITLAGKTAVGRAGVSQLNNLHLQELAAQTPEEFVQIAVNLAGDINKMAELRKNLRQRMQQSPLMDAKRFARNIEAAYRQMWRKWCGDAVNRIENT